MKKICNGNQGYCDVFEDQYGALYLVNLCGGIASGHVGIVMNVEERAPFANEPTAIDAVAQRMCRDFKPFEGREIPEAIRSSLV